MDEFTFNTCKAARLWTTIELIHAEQAGK